MVEAILTTLGLTKPATIGGFLGAVVSLKLIDGLNWWQGTTTVFSGALVAGYGTPLALDYFSLAIKLEPTVAFLIGVFGMSLAAAIVKAIPKAVDSRVSK